MIKHYEGVGYILYIALGCR